MNRREFLSKSCTGALSLALSGQVVEAASGSETRPPNVLFILTDQQRWDAIGASGNRQMHTPNLDRLSMDGIRFHNSYTVQAVCSPSRATIMSGLYPHAHGVTDNIYGIDDVTSMSRYRMQTIWPLLLQQAGYRTCYIGKWHLGEKAPKCFDEWHGFNSNMPHWMGEPYKSDYRSDVETEIGLAFLEKNAKRPFVLFQSYYPPHTPYTAPRDYWRYYENSSLRPLEYYAACSNIDHNIGRLLNKLEDLDLLDNTFIIFTSDHGDHFGKRPGGAEKRGAYDDCAKVPLTIHHPRLARGGTVRSELVTNADLMPTILDVAGIRAPEGLHGRSLLPLCKGRNVAWRDSVTIENREDAPRNVTGSGVRCNSRGVRTRDWKLILRDKLSVRAKSLREFYNLPSDPWERRDVYGRDHVREIEAMLKRLEAWARMVNDGESLKLAAACRDDLA